MSKLSPKSQAILLAISSAFCFALMNTLVRLAGDLPTVQKCLFRNMVTIPFALAVIMRMAERHPTPLKFYPGLILRSCFGTLGITCNYYAVDNMLLADASILNRLSPFVTTLLCWIFLKERLNKTQAVSILVAFIGALCIIRPGMGALTSFPALVAMLGGFGAGAAYTMVRWLTQNGVDKPFIVLFFSTFSTLAMLPGTLANYHPMTAEQTIILLLAGLTATGGQFSITYAYAKAPAREISLFDYTIVIFAGILGFFLFDQLPDIWSLLGYAIIIGVSVFMFLHDTQPKPHTPAAQNH